MTIKFFKNYYLLIPLLIVGIVYLQIISNETLGITPDSLDYIRIADDIPYIKNSLFPIFYPLTIKFINFFTKDYYLATKVICFISIFFAFAYTYIHNFFWKELWLVFCFPSFLDIYHNSWSETILIPLLIIFSHINYKYITQQKSRYFMLKNTIVIILMLLTKYSVIGIIFGYGFYFMFDFIFFKKNHILILESLLIVISFFLIYLLVNYLSTGHMMGERITPNYNKINIRYSFFKIIYNLNPIINDRYIGDYKINYIFLTVLTIIIYLPMTFVKKIKSQINMAFIFLLCSLFILALTFISSFVIKLDSLNGRLLMPFVFFLFVFLLVAFEKYNQKKYYKLYHFIFTILLGLGILIRVNTSISNLSKNLYKQEIVLKQIKEIEDKK